jgi:hypothetical protein
MQYIEPCLRLMQLCQYSSVLRSLTGAGSQLSHVLSPHNFSSFSAIAANKASCSKQHSRVDYLKSKIISGQSL